MKTQSLRTLTRQRKRTRDESGRRLWLSLRDESARLLAGCGVLFAGGNRCSQGRVRELGQAVVCPEQRLLYRARRIRANGEAYSPNVVGHWLQQLHQVRRMRRDHERNNSLLGVRRRLLLRVLLAEARRGGLPVTFPVYQAREWQCRYVFPDQKCCGLLIGHDGEHSVACGHGWHWGAPCDESPQAVGAVDPHAGSTGNPSTRDK